MDQTKLAGYMLASDFTRNEQFVLASIILNDGRLDWEHAHWIAGRDKRGGGLYDAKASLIESGVIVSTGPDRFHVTDPSKWKDRLPKALSAQPPQRATTKAGDPMPYQAALPEILAKLAVPKQSQAPRATPAAASPLTWDELADRVDVVYPGQGSIFLRLPTMDDSAMAAKGRLDCVEAAIVASMKSPTRLKFPAKWIIATALAYAAKGIPPTLKIDGVYPKLRAWCPQPSMAKPVRYVEAADLVPTGERWREAVSGELLARSKAKLDARIARGGR